MIFEGKTSLRHQYAEATVTNVSGTTLTTAYHVATWRPSGRVNFIDNGFDRAIRIALVHPEADPQDVANRLFWVEIAAGTQLNYGVSLAPSLQFDAGTKMYIYASDEGNPTVGKFRLAIWG